MRAANVSRRPEEIKEPTGGADGGAGNEVLDISSPFALRCREKTKHHAWGTLFCPIQLSLPTIN
jgi:hypothetical protein